MGLRHHIGESVFTIGGIRPQDPVPGTINGAAVNRTTVANGGVFLSGKLLLSVGAATGGPSAQTVDAKVQDSADGSTGWADLTDKDGNVIAVTQITADDTDESQSFDLAKAKAFIRTVVVVTLTGGTTPTIPVACTLALGGGETRPVAEV